VRARPFWWFALATACVVLAMRRPLDAVAVHSIAGEKSTPPPGKLRKTVSFSEFEEVIDQDGARSQTPPRVRGDSVAGRSSWREEQARRNLSRLVTNHRRVTDRWTDTLVCDCHATFSRAVSSCLPEQKSRGPWRHARIDGDVMFIGSKPGIVEDVLMLTAVDVTVERNTVAISSKGMLTVVQTLATEIEAESWAAKVRDAAVLWSQCEQQTEAALEANRQLEARSRADTGGTEQAVASGTGSADDADLAKGFAAGSKRRQGCLADRSKISSEPWVELMTTTGGHHGMLSSINASSFWSWMHALFGGPPAVMVA